MVETLPLRYEQGKISIPLVPDFSHSGKNHGTYREFTKDSVRLFRKGEMSTLRLCISPSICYPSPSGLFLSHHLDRDSGLEDRVSSPKTVTDMNGPGRFGFLP